MTKNYEELAKQFGGTFAGNVNEFSSIAESFGGKEVSQTQEPVEEKTNAWKLKTSFPAEKEESVVSQTLKLLGNIPSSTWNLAQSSISALNPLKHLETISKVPGEFKELTREAGGATEALKLTAKEIPSTLKKAGTMMIPKMFRQIADGDLEGARQTVVNDPVGQIAPILIIAKSAFDKIGKGAEFDKAISSIASPISKPIERAGQAIATGAKNIVTGVTGATTGAGKEAMEQAYKGEAVRGAKPGEIVESAKGALNKIVDKRSANYTKELAKLSKKGNLNYSSIESKLTGELEKFRIGIKNGKLDFSKSPIRNDKSAVRDITTVFEDVTKWTDKSPVGLDSLKKGINVLYSPTARSRSFVQAMKNEVNSVLKKQVPQYSKMTSGYRDASKLLSDMKALSLGGKANPDTIFRKLTSAMKQNNEFRSELLAELEKAGQTTIKGQIAGAQLSPWISRSVIGRSAAGISAWVGGLSMGDLALFATTSPKIMGEFMRVLGWSQQKTSSFLKMLDGVKGTIGVGGILPKQKEENN